MVIIYVHNLFYFIQDTRSQYLSLTVDDTSDKGSIEHAHCMIVAVYGMVINTYQIHMVLHFMKLCLLFTILLMSE